MLICVSLSISRSESSSDTPPGLRGFLGGGEMGPAGGGGGDWDSERLLGT